MISPCLVGISSQVASVASSKRARDKWDTSRCAPVETTARQAEHLGAVVALNRYGDGFLDICNNSCNKGEQYRLNEFVCLSQLHYNCQLSSAKTC